jgi:UDP-N-acetylglucosamine:LPS N-acetylglucosamine transferase
LFNLTDIATLQRDMGAADLVVSHGGAGTIIEALGLGAAPASAS